MLVPSPLLGFASSNILLHFQLGLGGQITSPQVPAGNQRDLAESGYVPGERINEAAARLRQLQGILDRDAAAQAEGSSTRSGSVQSRPNVNANLFVSVKGPYP